MTGFQKSPFTLEIKAGEKKAVCACGKSQTPPLCDGSHKGSGTTPHLIASETDAKVMICGCFQSKNRPYCDGSHRQIN